MSSCGRLCFARAAALALWQVWNQVDCDDEDTVVGAVPVCADDAQNVNRPASVRDFTVGRRFIRLTVDIMVGNVLVSYRDAVDRRTWQALPPELTAR